jgi:hypothetical protein
MDTPVPDSSRRHEHAVCQVQIRQGGQHIHLAAIFCHAPQSRLLKTPLLLDHPKWMLNLGSDVGLGCLEQIEKPALRSIRKPPVGPAPSAGTQGRGGLWAIRKSLGQFFGITKGTYFDKAMERAKRGLGNAPFRLRRNLPDIESSL